MSGPGKRFKVVQDAHGVWGILDTSEERRDLFGRGEFAPYASSDLASHSWVGLIVDTAIRLNKGEVLRREVHWARYEPRRP